MVIIFVFGFYIGGGEIWIRSVDDSIVSIGNKLGSGGGVKNSLSRSSILRASTFARGDRPPEAASMVRADAARPYREVIVMARDRGVKSGASDRSRVGRWLFLYSDVFWSRIWTRVVMTQSCFIKKTLDRPFSVLQPLRGEV